MSQVERPRVVVTGAGVISPLGEGAEVLHARWTAGECAIEGGEARCSAFDPARHLARKELAITDRFSQLALAAAEEAVSCAGWEGGLRCPRDEVGVVIGVVIGGIITNEVQQRVLLEKGPRRVSPLSLPRIMPNAAAALVALRYRLEGPTYTAGAACATGATAIAQAVRAIQAGDLRACLAGGAEAPFAEFVQAAFDVMGASSPTGNCRPFDARRDGLVMGEGAAVLALEREDDARDRGAPVIGEILGVGASADSYHLVAPEPQGRGAAKAISRALNDAGLSPEQVDYVNAQGTATQASDIAETRALKLALGSDVARGVPISSTKSALGHTLGAAGAVETVATLLALRDRVAPPTLGYAEPDPECDLDYVVEGPRPLAERTTRNGRGAIGITNAFGFGGHNVVLCVRAP